MCFGCGGDEGFYKRGEWRVWSSLEIVVWGLVGRVGVWGRVVVRVKGIVVEMGVKNVMVGRVLVRIVVNEIDRIELRKDG